MARIALPFVLVVVAVTGCQYDAHGIASSSEEAPAVPSDAGVGEDAERPGEPTEPTENEPADGDAGRASGLVHDDPAVMAAVRAWTARHREQGDLPTLEVGSCERTLDGLRILVPDANEFFRHCEKCNLTDDSPRCDRHGRANGCAPWHGVYEDGKVHALIVLDPSRAADPPVRDRLVVHETIHHLARCSDHPGDRLHEDRRLWCTDDPTCVTARAHAMLGL
ncbi:MAG: hypothetical protein ACOCUS_05705 [Polyangiales bacterium]